MNQESYNPKPSKSLEKCNELLASIFVKYADKEDDLPNNVSKETDFTSFVFNIHNKNFVIDKVSEKTAEDDSRKLCMLFREYSLHLKEYSSNEEYVKFIKDCQVKIDKILNKIKKFFPNIIIPENIKTL